MKAELIKRTKQEFIYEWAPDEETERFEQELNYVLDEVSREVVLKWHKAIGDFLGDINKQIESKQKQK